MSLISLLLLIASFHDYTGGEESITVAKNVTALTGGGEYDFLVTQDGSGDFVKIQDAINAVSDFRKTVTTIFIKNGLYKEKLILPTSKTNVKFIGEDALKTIISYDDFASKKNRFGEEIGTSGSTTFFVFADGFAAENITFENSAGPIGQAVAVRIDGDRVSFANCRFLGFQDTLYAYGEKSRQHYRKCYIEGTVDFIFGWSTAVFEDCTIYCKKGGGYITAASTMEGSKYGFVFLNCTITGNAGSHTYYLGRPWRANAKTAFINCFMDEQVKQEGWNNWNKPEAEATSFYAEYNSRGPGANLSQRVKWSHILSKAEASLYTVANILGDWKEPVPR